MSRRADDLTPLRILMVAQSPVLRYGIRTVLESVVDLEAFTEAGNALAAAAAARSVPLDLVVIHDALPGVTGTTATTMLRQLVPHARIVLMSDDVDEPHRVEAIRAGADRLLSMAIEPDGFAAVMDGLLGPTSPREDRLVEGGPAAPSLPAIQLAVLDGIVRGLPLDEIARRLALDERPIAEHTDALLARLDVVDRPSAVLAAVRLGLVDLSNQLPLPSFTSEFGIESAA